MTRYLLASDDVELEDRVRGILGAANGDLRRIGLLGSGGDVGKLAAHLTGPTAGDPDVVTLGPDLALDVALELAQQLDIGRPDASVVLLTSSGSTVLERAMRAGIRDVLSPDVEADVLASALQGAAEAASRRREGLATRRDTAHRIVTVISPKGGSGKTTMATNLAVGLARHRPGSVALVDLDLAFGDVATALGLTPEYTIGQAVAALGRDTVMGPKVFLTEHQSGVYALCAPETPEQAELLSSERTTELLRQLATTFPTVVVDTPAGLEDHSLAALEISTDILLVCTMDVPSIRSLRKAAIALDDLGFTHQRRHFILNRASSKVGLDERDVERTVGQPVDVSIPSARMVPLSMNQGEPVLASRHSSAVGRQLEELVARFLEEPKSEGSESLLRRLGSRWG